MRTKKQMVQEWLKLAKEFRARAEAYGGNSDDRMKTGYTPTPPPTCESCERLKAEVDKTKYVLERAKKRCGWNEEVKSYPNARDCEHGRQKGKCPECDLTESDVEREKLREQLNAAMGDVWKYYCLGQSDVYLRLARELCNHSYIEIAGNDSVFACEICGVEDGSVLEYQGALY